MISVRDNYLLCREATVHTRRRALWIAVTVWLLDVAQRLNRRATATSPTSKEQDR